MIPNFYKKHFFRVGYFKITEKFYTFKEYRRVADYDPKMTEKKELSKAEAFYFQIQKIIAPEVQHG